MRQSGTPFLRTLRSIAMIALLVTVAACGGGGGGGGGGVPPGGVTPVFAGSGSAIVPGFTTLGNPVDLGGGLMSIDLILGGPVVGADVFSFDFDIIISDPTIVEFVSGSATAGPALTVAPGQSLNCLVNQGINGPDAVAIVGIALLPPPGDNNIPDPSNVLCTMTFRVIAVGTSNLTFTATIGQAAPQALNSIGGVVGAITFDTVSATLSGI